MSVKLLGVKIDDYTFEEAVKKGIELINLSAVSQVVTINPEMLVYSENNEMFQNILKNSALVVPDGVGVKIALKLKGYSIERVPGIDYARKILEKSAEYNYTVGIVGAKPEVITKAVENLKNEINGINIVYAHDGYFSDDNLIYQELKEKSPNIILVAMGSPRQEEFIYNAKNILNNGLMIGIGGSLDVWSGNVKRAPRIFQKLGIEWLYRTVLQPERFKRIFPALPLFLLKVLSYKEK